MGRQWYQREYMGENVLFEVFGHHKCTSTCHSSCFAFRSREHEEDSIQRSFVLSTLSFRNRVASEMKRPWRAAYSSPAHVWAGRPLVWAGRPLMVVVVVTSTSTSTNA